MNRRPTIRAVVCPSGVSRQYGRLMPLSGRARSRLAQPARLARPSRSRANERPARLVVRQTVLPAYRQTFFEMLSERVEGSVRFQGGDEYFDPSVVTAMSAILRQDQLRNYFLFRRRLLFQVGGWRDALAAEVAVLEYNPRVLSNWPILLFGPTRRSREWVAEQDFPTHFHFHPYGLAAVDGHATFVMMNADPDWSSYNMTSATSDAFEVEELEVRRLGTLMAELGHDSIDILKLDIEGTEYDVLPDVIECKSAIDQLCIEFHFDRNKRSEVAKFHEAIRMLSSAGFTPFARSPSGQEISFLSRSR
jgi:FkbM family methyltransferase